MDTESGHAHLNEQLTAPGTFKVWILLKKGGSLSGLALGLDMESFMYNLNKVRDADSAWVIRVDPGDFLFVEAGTIHSVATVIPAGGLSVQMYQCFVLRENLGLAVCKLTVV